MKNPSKHSTPSVNAAVPFGHARANRGQPMAPVITSIDNGLTALPIDHTRAPDRPAAISDHDMAGEGPAEDANSSVLGEEDPGAALDLAGPTTIAPEACRPWPGERSA